MSVPEAALKAPRRPRTSFLVFGSPFIGEEAIAEVVHSLRSGWIGTGPKVGRFERDLEHYIAVAHVRCLASCTAALWLGLRTLGIGRGDEVLLPAMTFVASANAVEQVGARPVLVDSEPATGLMDLDAAEAAIGPRTAAIMPVHLGGRPVDLDRVNAIRDRRGLAVIEDAAHALGAQWRGRRIGSHGNLTAFSFYVTKNLTTIEGGALASDSCETAERVERLALHGLSVGAWQRYTDGGFRHYEVVEPGFKLNMTDVQAALGLHQLPHLERWIARRAEQFARYDRALANLPLHTPPPASPGTVHARHLYSVLLDTSVRLSRDEVLDQLASRKIGAGVHYRGVHLHPYYRDRYSLRPESFPVATDISERTFSLPLGPKVSDDDLDDVVEALHAILGPANRCEASPLAS
jgi:dTDP-4-amino-4,6-dideoxygalactose transaminase